MPDSMSEWSSKTVEELKRELVSRGLSVSGKKSELIGRLESGSSSSVVLEAEIVGTPESSPLGFSFDRLKSVGHWKNMDSPITTFFVAGIMILGATGGGILYSDEIIEWIQGDQDYVLIEFDANQTRAYAEGLVSLGHPEWGGRLSGTVEEENTAQSIKTNFSNSGMPSTLEEFEVPLFYMGNQFDLMICQPGNVGGIIGGPTPCSIADFDRDETEFEHRVDYVVQGYSGDVNIVASSNTQVIELGIGNESEDWGAAANGIGVVWLLDGQDGQAGTESNTVLMKRAQENSLRGLITVNAKQNCDELVEGDCVPYSKSLDITQFDEEPYNIGFVMVSKSVGEMIVEQVVDGDGMLQFQVEVDNQVEAYIHVPCGIIEGETDSLIIIGAHHDTVYNGQGAVDNTAGTATVQEMARQIGLLQSELGQPKMTIYFCTWGGEEEGLWGSSEWVKKHQAKLRDNLRLYINLDMNHVDAQRNSGLTLQGNSPGDVKRIEGIVSKFSKVYPELAEKYDITVRDLDSEDMPYNSDHAPFVYNLDEDGGEFGRAMLCYGSGSSEYHTYLDNMDRFNEESLVVSGIIYGSLVRHLAWA
ncbi:MAG: M28 family peptidase [Candidatus Thalassarchaeum sp.]|nr:M28 family peptidase [Candidatus Thalassarchaeum sp.]